MTPHEELIEACGVRLHELKTSNEALKKQLNILANRVDKFIDRRFEDDGPDHEYSKLYDELVRSRTLVELAND